MYWKITDPHTTKERTLLKYEKEGSIYIWGKVSIDRSEIFHTSLNFAAVRGKKLPSTWTSKCPSKIKQTKLRERDVYLFYFETLWLGIWHACSFNIILFYQNCRLYILLFHTFSFFRRLKRVGSVLSKSELDPFHYI